MGYNQCTSPNTMLLFSNRTPTAKKHDYFSPLHAPVFLSRVVLSHSCHGNHSLEGDDSHLIISALCNRVHSLLHHTSCYTKSFTHWEVLNKFLSSKEYVPPCTILRSSKDTLHLCRLHSPIFLGWTSVLAVNASTYLSSVKSLGIFFACSIELRQSFKYLF